jgi:hypothetical protein
MRRFYIVMLVLNVTAFVLGVSALIYYSLVSKFSDVPFIRVFLSHEAPSGYLIWALFGPLCLVFFSIAGYFLSFPRLYAYGLLTGLSPFVGEWLWLQGRAPHHGIPVTFGITAGIMILTGLVVFVRLLRNNPLSKEKDAAGE